jgi:monoamine oxidase
VAGVERVIVIGGGAAGLAAAAALAGRAEVVLLEARDRLGGRVDSRLDPALWFSVEHGAEFVHGRLPLTWRLARRARARVLRIPDRHASRLGPRLAGEGGAFARAQELLALGARDEEPFAAVLRRARGPGRAPPTAVRLAEGFVRGFYLADPRTASSLALARMTQALEEAGSDAVFRVEGGYARVLEPLRATLARRRAEIRLSTRVEEVRWRKGRVEVLVRGAAGGRLSPVRGARAVVTLPTGLLAGDGMRFRPDLPEKRRAAAALAMGPVVKVLLRLRPRAWEALVPRALTFLHVPGAPVPVFWTHAPARAPVLVGWAGGPDAARLARRPEEAVLRAALRSAARGLGRAPLELEDALDGASVIDWSRDPFARGGYAVFPTGSAWAPDALARPVEGTLFFAGEATAGGLAGTVEGALASGERAARELLAAARGR